ncbi:MAG: site-specific integrase [Oscillospiraceae bacterium]|nr:site-specific integrase [Oscillospiraceae bacterium]
MATARKRGDSYQIAVSCGYDVNGRQSRQYFTWTPPAGMTAKQEAKELERQKVLFEERANAGVTKDGSIRFQAFSETWLKEYAELELKAKTVDGYRRRLLRINQAIGHIKLKDLRVGHLNSFYANLREEGMREDDKFCAKADLSPAVKAQAETLTAFAQRAGVSLATLKQAMQRSNINPESAAAIAAALGRKRAELFTEQHVHGETLSSSSVRSFHRVISSILTKAVKWGYIAYNPAVNAELPKMPAHKAAYLDEADIRRMLELLQEEPIKYRAMIGVDVMSGLRRGELLGLRWCDVDFVSETVSVVQTSSYVKGKGVFIDTPKNRTSDRVLKLSRSVFILLREYKDWQDAQRDACGDFWKDKDGRVFTGDDGAPVFPDVLTKWFAAFVKRSGLPHVTIHSLRHTYASILIAQGTPLIVVSSRMGHAQASTTANIYAHIIKSADEKASQVTEMFADSLVPEKPQPAFKRKKSTSA